MVGGAEMVELFEDVEGPEAALYAGNVGLAGRTAEPLDWAEGKRGFEGGAVGPTADVAGGMGGRLGPGPIPIGPPIGPPMGIGPIGPIGGIGPIGPM